MQRFKSLAQIGGQDLNSLSVIRADFRAAISDISVVPQQWRL